MDSQLANPKPKDPYPFLRALGVILLAATLFSGLALIFDTFENGRIYLGWFVGAIIAFWCSVGLMSNTAPSVPIQYEFKIAGVFCIPWFVLVCLVHGSKAPAKAPAQATQQVQQSYRVWVEPINVIDQSGRTFFVPGHWEYRDK